MNVLVVALLAAISFTALTAAATALAYPHARSWIGRLSGERRSAILLGVLATPFVAGILLTALALLPGLVGIAWPGLDHCTGHDDHHFHLCLVHTPGLAGLGSFTAFICAAFVPAGVRLGATAVRVHRARRLVGILDTNATLDAGGSHAVVESELPFALTAGLLAPRVFVTSALLRDLDSTSIAAMLAHEAAHVRRRDPLRKLLGDMLSAFHLPGARSTLLADLSLACEESCDESAAAQIGDRADVAAALVALGRLIERTPERPALVGAAFGDSDIETRVRSLLSAPKIDPRIPSRGVWIAGATLVAALVVVPVHHITESLLGSVLG
ncbi:MAG: M56 family metallopeptidase [Nannocystales bacterium]